MCYAGAVADGEQVAQPLRAFGHPVADVVAPDPFTAWQTVLDPLLTPGARNYWKSHDFLGLEDGLIDVLIEHASAPPRSRRPRLRWRSSEARSAGWQPMPPPTRTETRSSC